MQNEEIRDKDGEIVMPFVRGLMFPFETIKEHLSDFLYLTGGISLVTTLIMLLFGRSFLCNIAGNAEELYCSYNAFSFSVSSVVLLLGAGFYFSRWQLISFGGKSGREAVRCLCFKRDFQAVLFVLLYLALWAVVGGCLYFLNVRKPVDVWQQELLFFVGMSLLILASLFILINFVIFIRLLQGKKWLVINQTFWPVFDNIYKVIVWFIFYMFFFVFICRIIFVALIGGGWFPLWVRNIIGEFGLNFVLYTIVCFFVSSLNYQAQCIFGDE